MTPHRQLLERAADMFGVRVADIFAPTRKEDATQARFAVCRAMLEQRHASHVIAEVIGRDPSTVRHAWKAGWHLAKASPRFATRVRALATGNPLPAETTFSDVLHGMANLTNVSVEYLLDRKGQHGRPALLAAAILVGLDYGITKETMARTLRRSRAAVVELARGRRTHREQAEALAAIYHRNAMRRAA